LENRKDDADDPAIWIHPIDPSKSVIIGTDKDKDSGGLYVWDLQGRQIQHVQLPGPNNVDVRYGFDLGERVVDIAVTNLRSLKEIKANAQDRPSDRIFRQARGPHQCRVGRCRSREERA
jgi:3-phytase